MSLDLLHGAISNNISWCSKICALHGSSGQRTPEYWINKHPSPPYYPNIITTKPDCQTSLLVAIEEIRDAGMTGPWGIKDSFGDLSLSDFGFSKVIDGHWFVYVSTALKIGNSKDWRLIDKSELDHWVTAWHGHETEPPDIFRPQLLEVQNVSVLAKFSEGLITHGCIADMSDGVAGLSNWFGPTSHGKVPDGLVETLIDHDQVPIVCWSDTKDNFMAEAGFSPIGAMAVWISQR